MAACLAPLDAQAVLTQTTCMSGSASDQLLLASGSKCERSFLKLVPVMPSPTLILYHCHLSSCRCPPAGPATPAATSLRLRT